MANRTNAERDVKAYLLRRVKALGGEARKVKWEGRTGAPDWLVMFPEVPVVGRWGQVVCIRKPRSLWLELKAPGKPPEPHQLREHERMRAAGLEVHVVDSFEKVDEALA